MNDMRLMLGLALWGGLLAAGVASAEVSPANAYVPPKTAWGAPDLQGYWSNASVTRLSRPRGIEKLTLTPEEAKAIEDRDYFNVRDKEDRKPIDPATAPPEKGKALPPVGNYNAVWVDAGSRLARVRGEARTSWIVDPPDGTMPPLTVEGQKAIAAARGGRSAAGPDAAARSYEGPESRSNAERCLISFTGAGGPVMLNGMYNNTYQLVQEPDHVMILVEMVHDVRIIRLGGVHAPSDMPKWLGDSVGRWQGETLVVETRNVTSKQTSPVFLSASGRLIERFTRIAPDEIFYEFEVDDPATYTRTWRGEMPLRASREPVFEYACHEGNYGLVGILEGARQQELKGAALELTAETE